MSPSSFFSSSFLSVALYTLAATAQQASVLDLSKLPSCANTCAVLIQASQQCVPPTAPVTNQAAYQGCFCDYGPLAAFHSNPQALQCSCSESDLGAIQSYYNSLCASDPSTTTTTQTTATKTTATKGATQTTDTTSTPGSSQNGQPQANTNTASKDKKESWFSGHWQWVLLVIILTIAFVFFLVGGFWLKRRYHRREEARLSGMGDYDARSPYSAENISYVGGAGNHPQMTVVPGAGNDAAMARYDGSGVGSLGSRPQSMARTSNVGAVANNDPDTIYNAAPRDVSFDRKPPPVLATMRSESDDSQESQRKKLRTTLRRSTTDDDVEAIGSGSERRPARRGSGKLKGKLKKTVGL